MDTKFQTSFIPKKPVLSSNKISYEKKPTSIFSLIGVSIFLIALLGVGGVFFYKGYLTNRIQSLSDQLGRMSASFEPELIDELARLDNRLKVGQTLLAGHLSSASFFEWLEAITLQNVQFTDFKYNDGGGTIAIEMRGKARDYETLVSQSDIFAEDSAVKKAVFSNLDLDQNGNVIFSLAMTFNSSSILYKNSLQTLSIDGFPFK